MTLELSRQNFEKSSYIHNLIRQMGAELLHADRRTDRQKLKLNSSFSQFWESAQK